MVIMNVIRQLRERNGISQTWLAKELGIHRATLWGYENAKSNPPKSVLFHAAHLLRVSPDELIEHAQIHS
jgi:putative transcriptional regulator